MNYLGNVGEHPIYFENNILYCKNVVLEFSKFKEAYNSAEDRIILKEDLTLIKGADYIKLGCLFIWKNQVKTLLKKIYEISNKRK